MMIKKKAKKVIPMLLKFEQDVETNIKKTIIYEDEIDGLPDYEPHSPTEDEEQEEGYNNYNKVQNKSKKRPPPSPKQIEKPKQPRKGITKSIKMQYFVFFVSCDLNVNFCRQDAKSYIK